MGPGRSSFPRPKALRPGLRRSITTRRAQHPPPHPRMEPHSYHANLLPASMFDYFVHTSPCAASELRVFRENDSQQWEMPWYLPAFITISLSPED